MIGKNSVRNYNKSYSTLSGKAELLARRIYNESKEYSIFLVKGDRYELYGYKENKLYRIFKYVLDNSEIDELRNKRVLINTGKNKEGKLVYKMSVDYCTYLIERLKTTDLQKKVLEHYLKNKQPNVYLYKYPKVVKNTRDFYTLVSNDLKSIKVISGKGFEYNTRTVNSLINKKLLIYITDIGEVFTEDEINTCKFKDSGKKVLGLIYLNEKGGLI